MVSCHLMIIPNGFFQGRPKRLGLTKKKLTIREGNQTLFFFFFKTLKKYTEKDPGQSMWEAENC